MSDLPAGLTYLLIFVAVLLFQFVLKRYGPQEEQATTDYERAPEYDEEVREAPVAASKLPAAGSGQAQAARSAAAAPLARRRFSRQSLFGTKREVQNAIVIATILGPCRAFKPHDAE